MWTHGALACDILSNLAKSILGLVYKNVVFPGGAKKIGKSRGLKICFSAGEQGMARGRQGNLDWGGQFDMGPGEWRSKTARRARAAATPPPPNGFAGILSFSGKLGFRGKKSIDSQNHAEHQENMEIHEIPSKTYAKIMKNHENLKISENILRNFEIFFSKKN